MCGMVINGRPHGPQRATTTCQLHMRSFRDGAELWIEPWRARAFPVIKDLVVDRGAFDRIIQAGGFITARTEARRKRTACSCPSATPTSRWTRPLASDAAPVWQPAPTRRPRCS